MIWMHQGKKIPIEVYHGVPTGWHAEEVFAEHTRLGGTFDLSGPQATEPGAPSWMPDRNAWLQYRETLHRIADGVNADDLACVELAVRYLKLRYIGSYSGYIRSLLSRHLKHAMLSTEQQGRLHRHFCNLALIDQGTHEYKDYLKLWRLFITAEQAREVLGNVVRSKYATKRLPELLKTLLPNVLP